MTKFVSQAPARPSFAIRRNWKRRRLVPSLFTLCLIGLFLAGCGTSPAVPKAIQANEDGKVVLRFDPAAEAVEIYSAVSSARVAASSPTRSGELITEKRFDLEPGRYEVSVTWPGLGKRIGILDVPELEFATDEFESVFREGNTEPAPIGEEPEDEETAGGDSGTGGSDGSGDGTLIDDGNAVVVPRTMKMTVDPAFSLTSLDEEQRLWYERMWVAMASPDSGLDPDQMAASDDTYVYARDLHNHLQTLLMVFRATGDLRLLEEVDRLTWIMRGELDDAWEGTLDDTDGTTDGYLGWAFRYGDYPLYEGKDTHEVNDIKTHAIIATVAYALELNREYDSDFAQHADFWKDYLSNHFEAKWRKREAMPTGYPVLIRPHTHTYMSGLKYHYYMYKLTGTEGYLDEARRNSRMLWENEIKAVSVGSRQGYVWARSVLSEGGRENYLHPTTYARYVYLDAIELFFEGFDRWSNESDLSLFANPVAEWVIDPEGAQSGSDWFGPDIGGGTARGGIPSEAGWKRLTTRGWSWTPYMLLAQWDESGRIAEISVDTLRSLGSVNSPGAVYIPAGLFLDTWLDNH